MAESRIEPVIRMLTNRQRRGDKTSLEAVAEVVEEAGLLLTTEEASALLFALQDPETAFLPTRPVLDAAIAVLRLRPIRSLLDPYAGLGILPVTIGDRLELARLVTIERYTQLFQLSRMLNSDAVIDRRLGDPARVLPELDEQFDAVVTLPPIGMAPESQIVQTPSGPISVRDSPPQINLLRALGRLSDDGIAVIVTVPATINAAKPGSFVSVLPQFGFALVAAFRLPAGSLGGATQVPATLAVIEHGVPSQVFVASLSGEHSHDARVLSNFVARRVETEPSLGRLLSLDELESSATIAREEYYETLAQEAGLERHLMSEFLVELNRTRAAEAPGFDQRENAVYLPLIGTSDAVASLSELRLKPHNYAQLVLRPEQVDARYVAGYLNGELGRAARSDASSGTIIKHINNQTARAIPVYLPHDLETQHEAVAAAQRVRSLAAELHELGTRIWSHPRQLPDTVRRLNLVNREDRFTDWLETLPFPLAILLWVYHTSGTDPDRRIRRLLQFFEALAEFVSTLLLSGYRRDQQLYREYRAAINGALAKAGLSLERATFGVWKIAFEYLSSRVRSQLAVPSQRDQTLQLFAIGSDTLLEAVTSTRMVAAIGEVISRRNRWDAHGPQVSEKLANERHQELRAILASVRDLLGGAWEPYELLQPIGMQGRGGQIDVECRRLMGSHPTFEVVTRPMSQPLYNDRLYLSARGLQDALQLLPLIKMMPSPRTDVNACYFFNRQERNGGIRFVSYHYEIDADVTDSFADTAATILELSNAPELE